MPEKIRSHRDLEVYDRAFDAAVQIFELTKAFPKEEMFSLTDQVRRSSRSVCANLAEAWRKRRYPSAFASKLADCESEAAETQTWIEFSVSCGYLDNATARTLYRAYDRILATLVGMTLHLEKWTFPEKTKG